jgi:hypothetical protein
MVEISFLEFHEQQYPADPFCLYVMNNGVGDVLYIGISTNSVWERWFAAGGHITWNSKIIYGESPIGVKIENHLPESLQWKIQLWTLNDCLEFCRDELPTEIPEITIHQIESAMIRKLSPALNVHYNPKPGKDTTPLSQNEINQEKKLDRLYKEMFDKL